jgi:UDP-GlcNAc:undecaprenyl-phosphate GlcNAc-1-phosphate transferase
MDIYPVLAFTLSLFTTIVLIPVLIKIAERFQLVDQPGGRKGHVKPVPRLGGIAMAAGVWLPIFLWMDLSPTLKTVLCGMAVLSIVGLLDDLLTLDWKAKLLAQTGVAVLVVLYGKIEISYLGYWSGQDVFLPVWLSVPLSVLFIVGVTNAINLADGLDGLAAGICLFIFGLLAFLAYLQGATEYLIPLAALIGSIWGFLRFNTFPAIIFMGDSGSYLLGFSAAVFSVLCTQLQGSAVAPSIVLVILGIPVVDTLVVMIERFLKRQPVFKADRRHVHYRLVRLGFSHREAVIIIYVVQAVLVYAALRLTFLPDFIVLASFLEFVLLVIGGLFWATKKGWRFKKIRQRENSISSLFGGNAGLWLVRLPLVLTSGLLCIYVVALSILPHSDLARFGWALLGIPITVIACFFLKRDWFNIVSRAGIYCFLAVTTYTLVQDAGGLSRATVWYWLFLGTISLLACATLVYIKFAGPDVFWVTPLDVLIVLVTLAVPLLPVEATQRQNMGLLLISLIVLYFSVEVALSQGSSRWQVLHTAVALGGFVVGTRSVVRLFL